MIVEAIRIGHPHSLVWMTGDGTRPEGDSSKENITHGGSAGVALGPLPAWRVRGMCGDIISQLDGRETHHQFESLDAE